MKEENKYYIGDEEVSKNIYDQFQQLKEFKELRDNAFIYEEGKEDNLSLKVHCKPTYNYQSVEFDWEIKYPEDQEHMFEVYKGLLEGLIAIAPAQPEKGSTVVKEEPATVKQLEILKKFKIPHNPHVSKEEASKLIQNNLKKDC